MQINEVPNAKVGIVAGSKSDQETVDKITAVLDQFGITWEYNISKLMLSMTRKVQMRVASPTRKL